MIKVLWFSRHEMNEAQKNDLVKVFGEIQINQVDKTITSAKEIENEIKDADVIALVAPIDIQQQVLKIAGDKPVITSLTSREFIPDGEGGKQKVVFSHIKWERLVKIDIVKEDIIPIKITSALLYPDMLLKIFDPYLYIEIPNKCGGRSSGGKGIHMNTFDLDAVRLATTPGELLGGFADDYLNSEDFEIVKRQILETIVEIRQYLFTMKSIEIFKWNGIINSDDFIHITNHGFSFREKEQREFRVTGSDDRPTVRVHIMMNLVPDNEELVNRLNKYAYDKFGLEPLPSLTTDFSEIMDYIHLIAKFATLGSYDIRPGSNAIELDNKKYLQNDYGKYCSNLTFVVSYDNIRHYKFKEDNILKRTMNVKWDGDPKFMYGRFWTSKKGALCFEPLPEHKATHILIQLRWGGAFDSSSGCTTIPDALYKRRASSNGGGAGYTYYVVEKHFSRTVTEDDF